MLIVKATYGRFLEGPLYSSIDELDHGTYQTENIVRLTNARVILANYELLQHDFPWLRDDVILKEEPLLGEGPPGSHRVTVERRIDEWLLNNAAVFSRSYAAQTVVNGPIEVQDEGKLGYRPPRYGRALVIPVAHGGQTGLLDVKGVGMSPETRARMIPQLNGLSYLGEVLSDFFAQMLVDAVMAEAMPTITTVPVYAIIDAGFNARFMDGDRLGPAGILVRRAHQRPSNQIERPIPESEVERIKLINEMILRSYGVTSTLDDSNVLLAKAGDELQVHHGGIPQELSPLTLELLEREILRGEQRLYLEGVNVQLTRHVKLNPPTAEIVDFGQYNVRERFEHPVMCLLHEHPAFIGTILRPEHPAFVQPSPALRVPYGLWGEKGHWTSIGPSAAFQYEKEPVPRYRAIAYALAHRFRRGISDRADIDRALADLLGPVVDHRAPAP